MRAWLIVFLTLLWLPAGSQADIQHATQASNTGQATIGIAELPPEARDTLSAIKRGGLYAYERDGVVFGNYEGLLPKQPRGYYHEYTVKTSGTRGRGARRIVTGRHGEFYYTADHYNSFLRIME